MPDPRRRGIHVTSILYLAVWATLGMIALAVCTSAVYVQGRPVPAVVRNRVAGRVPRCRRGGEGIPSERSGIWAALPPPERTGRSRHLF